MKINKRRQNSEPLHYRLYILYFEGPSLLVKSIKKDAFYRLSILHNDEQIAQMMEGVNPTILADKIFLKDAQINFELLPQQHDIKLRLWYHLGSSDSVLSESSLSLGDINQDFLQQQIKYHGQQSTIFEVGKQSMKLVFNIFVDVDKKDLASYIRIFKEREREELKQKRLSSSKQKQKAKSPTHYSSIMLIERKSSLMSKIDIGFNKDNKSLVDSLTFKGNLFQSLKQEELKEIKEEELKDDKKQIGKDKEPEKAEENKEESKLMESVTFQIPSPKNYLEIESAARFHKNQPQKNSNNNKKHLQEIEEKEIKSVYSNQYHVIPETPSKGVSLGVGGEGASVISDGSQASQMIANNLNQSYSERAVAKFKKNFLRFVNFTLIIIAIVLLYFLFVPRAKFSKNPKPRRSRFSRAAEDQQI